MIVWILQDRLGGGVRRWHWIWVVEESVRKWQRRLGPTNRLGVLHSCRRHSVRWITSSSFRCCFFLRPRHHAHRRFVSQRRCLVVFERTTRGDNNAIVMLQQSMEELKEIRTSTRWTEGVTLSRREDLTLKLVKQLIVVLIRKGRLVLLVHRVARVHQRLLLRNAKHGMKRNMIGIEYLQR